MRFEFDERQALLALARKTLVAAFTETPDEPYERWLARETELPPVFLKPHPCFVTLTGKRKRLRGCIGCTVTDRKLYENVHLLTRQAAFYDPRFRPVEIEELAGLVLKITVLGPPTPLPTLGALMPGMHGIIVQNGKARAVLLAEVASTYGWTAEEFLKQACLKAGLSPERVGEYQLSYFEEVAFGETVT